MRVQLGELDQPLITRDTVLAIYQQFTFYQRLSATWKKLIRKNFSFENRIIKPNYVPYPRYLFNPDNKIDNTKFTWYNFIPLFLYYEFSQFSNFYYLLLTITQFFKPLQVGFIIRIFDFVHRTFDHHSFI